MKGVWLIFIALIITFLSCKKEKTNPPQNTDPGPAPVSYPCPAPNFTNVINPNGTKIVKSYMISGGGTYKSTSFYYYDVSNRIIDVKHWDTLNSMPGFTYSCAEEQFQYNAFGKVIKQTSYQYGGVTPKFITDFYYDATPRLDKVVRTDVQFGGIDTSKYTYYPGKVIKNTSQGQYVYYVNATNNVDSVDSPFDIPYVYTYDGKINPFKDFYLAIGPVNGDQNVIYIMDSSLSILSTFSYTYNANNLPLVGSRTNEITYYFYE